MKLTIHNIVNEMEKMYALVPFPLLANELQLYCNYRTYYTYICALNTNCVPKPVNFRGIDLIVQKDMPDDTMYIRPL